MPADEVGVVDVGVPDRPVGSGGGHDRAGDQIVLAEAFDHPVELALEPERRPFDEDTVDRGGRVGSRPARG